MQALFLRQWRTLRNGAVGCAPNIACSYYCLFVEYVFWSAVVERYLQASFCAVFACLRQPAVIFCRSSSSCPVVSFLLVPQQRVYGCVHLHGTTVTSAFSRAYSHAICVCLSGCMKVNSKNILQPVTSSSWHTSGCTASCCAVCSAAVCMLACTQVSRL